MARKRGNGEGTIYRRKNGTYVGQALVLFVDGTRKRKTVTGKTRQEVHEKLTALLGQSQQGVPIPDRTWKLGDFLDYWLENGVRAKRKPATYDRHESVVRLHIKPVLGSQTLHTLTVPILDAYFNRLRQDGCSDSSLKHIRTTLRAALSYAMRQQLLVQNVVQFTEAPNYKPKKSKLWSDQERQHFFETASSDPLYPAFVVSVLCGMRRGEVLGLKWSDFNFAEGFFHIERQLTPKMRLASVKTTSSERDQPITKKLAEVLQQQRAAQDAVRREMGSGWLGTGEYEGLVFTTRTGRPVSPRNMDRSFDRLIETSGVSKIKLHDLRDTNATTQKNLNIPLRDTQAILGHSDIRVTGGYERADLDNKRKALEEVEKVLFPNKVTAVEGDSGYALQTALQTDPSFVVNTKLLFSGSRGGTRTRDPRLMSPEQYTMQHHLASVRRAVAVAARMRLIGCVAVYVAAASYRL